MQNEWASWVGRWTAAGVIDADTADRIRAFEHAHGAQRRLRWPILLALAFGGLMLGGGILLFVAAHWDALSPTARFSLVLLMVGGLHASGAMLTDRFAGMSETLHAVGTIALGGGIALGGQIFNLDEHWPGGIMMWALGAGLAAWLLRHTLQIVLFAILAPAWLAAEWVVLGGARLDNLSESVLAGGAVLLALTYFTAVDAAHPSNARRALMWTGALTLPPLAVTLAFIAGNYWNPSARAPFALLLTGTAVATGLPLGLSFALRRRDAWPTGLALVWVVALIVLGRGDRDVPLYAWWALGATGLVAWGVADGRVERVNMGAAMFAATVLAFYFSEVMDKLGRSASLIGLGLLFLGGGWALDRLRRRLIVQARGER
jgi:uncharacterized membrane protein